MTSDELRTIGETLYGPWWQTRLARALGVAPRTVRCWMGHGRHRRGIRPIVVRSIYKLMHDQNKTTP